MLNGRPHDKRIDHWSLGCIAFEVRYHDYHISNNCALWLKTLMTKWSIFIAFNRSSAVWKSRRWHDLAKYAQEHSSWQGPLSPRFSNRRSCCDQRAHSAFAGKSNRAWRTFEAAMAQPRMKKYSPFHFELPTLQTY